MSNFIKDLHDYNLVQKCSKCGNLCLKSNVHKDNKRKNGVQRIFIFCFKLYHNNRKERRNALEREKRTTNFNFKLICNILTRTNKAITSQNIEKTNKTIDLMGCFSFF